MSAAVTPADRWKSTQKRRAGRSERGAPRLRSVQLLMTVMIALAGAIGVTAPHVCAQGNVPLVPLPMETRDLMQVAQHIDFSPQQRQSLLAMHEDYRRQYGQLHDVDVRKLWNSILDVYDSFRASLPQPQIPPRADLEAIIKQYEQIIDKAKRIDAMFFDRISGMASEEQLPAVQTARVMRELRLYRDIVISMAGDMNEGTRANLIQLAGDLELSPEEREQVQPILQSYESQLLHKSRDVFDGVLEGARLVLDAVDAMGLRQMSVEELMQLGGNEEFEADAKVRFNDGSKPLQKAMHELADLNLETFRRLRGVLEKENARKLRHEFYQRSYGEFYGSLSWREEYESVLELGTIDEETKGAVRSQYEIYDQQDVPIADKMVQLVHDWREYRTVDDMEEERTSEKRAEAEEQRDRRNQIDEAALVALRTVVGDEIYAEINPSYEDDERQMIVMDDGGVTVAVEVEGTDPEEAVEEVEREPREGPKLREDPRLPDPITEQMVETIVKALNWDDGPRAMVSSLHDRYRKRFDAARVLPEGAAAAGAEPSAPADAMLEVEELSTLIEALLAADNTFFDDVSLLADADEQKLVEHIRQMHRRSAQAEVSSRLGSWWNRGGEDVDIFAVLLEVDLEPQVLQSLEEVLSGFDKRAAEASDSRLSASWDGQRYRLMMERAREGEEFPQAERDKWGEHWREITRASRRLASLNRTAVERVLRELPEDLHWPVQERFYEKAYPEIFSRDNSAEQYLTQAVTFADVTPQQRQRIDEIAFNFRARHRELSQQMIEQRQKPNFEDNFEFDGPPPREMIDTQITLERLRFERQEANERAKAELAIVLDPEQAERIAGLHERERSPWEEWDD